mgnify:CR=1 FL=1
MRSAVKAAKRIVVKIGTSSLTHENGRVDLNKMERLARVLTDLNNSGKEIILVSGIRHTRRFFAPEGEFITEAKFPLKEKFKYVRFDIVPSAKRTSALPIRAPQSIFPVTFP